MTNDLESLCVNTIRTLSIDAVQRANSGHPGLPLGAAAMAFVLWTRFLKHNPQDPLWPDRDRFVLSPGHGSMLLYSLLHLTGYDLPLDELKRFRQWGSRTPGHPERGRQTPGVEVSTGPLGQGFANGVGMADANETAEAWGLAIERTTPTVLVFTRQGLPVLDRSDAINGRTERGAYILSDALSGMPEVILLGSGSEVNLCAKTQLWLVPEHLSPLTIDGAKHTCWS